MTHALAELDALLAAIRGVRVAVYGDFALDAYWELDESRAERSVETGLAVRTVAAERYSPGGAGNVAANLAALGVLEVRAVGPVGDDPFGALLRATLMDAGVDVSELAAPRGGWRTTVYGKPVRGGAELERLDFGTRQALAEPELDALAERLARAAAGCGAVVLNQQIEPGACPAAMVARLSALAERQPGIVFVADSRHLPARFRAVALKTNDVELARAAGVRAARPLPAEQVRALALARARELGRPVFATRGELGLVVACNGEAELVPAVPVRGAADPVGAGDTATAALAAALAAGASPLAAGRLAVAAASVTAAKLGKTGTATPEEVRAALACAPA